MKKTIGKLFAVAVVVLITCGLSSCYLLLASLIQERRNQQETQEEAAWQERLAQEETTRQERLAQEEALRQQRQEQVRQQRLEQAQELILGAEVSGNINRGEVHWFKFRTTETRRVVVYTSGNTDTYLEVYNPDNRLIAEDDDGGEGNNAKVTIPVESNRTYLIQLSSGFDRGPYRIVAVDEAILEAERAAREEAQTAAREARFNPNRLDRSQYRVIKVEDFSFDMVAGNIATGAKVAFNAKFLTKPTGTSYRFENVDMGITLSTTHNFVRDMPDRCFGLYETSRGWQSQDAVKVFVTVKRPGKSGECSIDIIEW
jgi:type II secretory pathway pseudopilin PulG